MTTQDAAKTLYRLHFNYLAAPETIHMPHGLERLRMAYRIYLSELDGGELAATFTEARQRLSEWSSEVRRQTETSSRNESKMDRSYELTLVRAQNRAITARAVTAIEAASNRRRVRRESARPTSPPAHPHHHHDRAR